MKEFDNLSNINKTLIGVTILLLLYGYVSRVFKIYFFWECKIIGWELLIFTTISILIEKIKSKKREHKKTLSEKIFTGVLIFILLIQSILFIVIPQTNAYTFAQQFLMTDKTISNELGEVYKTVLVPVGGMSISSSSAGETGEADLFFIVKGRTGFKDIHLQLAKELNTDWTIIETK